MGNIETIYQIFHSAHDGNAKEVEASEEKKKELEEVGDVVQECTKRMIAWLRMFFLSNKKKESAEFIEYCAHVGILLLLFCVPDRGKQIYQNLSNLYEILITADTSYGWDIHTPTLGLDLGEYKEVLAVARHEECSFNPLRSSSFRAASSRRAFISSSRTREERRKSLFLMPSSSS